MGRRNKKSEDSREHGDAKTTKALRRWPVRVSDSRDVRRNSTSYLVRTTDYDPGFLSLARHAKLPSAILVAVLSKRCLAMARLLAQGWRCLVQSRPESAAL